jgi:hypothetical protein
LTVGETPAYLGDVKTHFLHGAALSPLCGVSKDGALGSLYTDAVDCSDCARDARFHEAQKRAPAINARMEHVTRGEERREAEPQKGLRFNKRKLPVHLISPFVTKALAMQLQFGIDKGYPSRNWEKGLSWSETIASLERHLLRFKMGFDFDDEENPITKEKLPELYGVLCNAMFLLHFYETQTGTDDRVKYVRGTPVSAFDEVKPAGGAWSQEVREETAKPHAYQATERGGCAHCGVGPGAYVHNSEAIEKAKNS